MRSLDGGTLGAQFCAVTAAGAVKRWGGNNEGALGIGGVPGGLRTVPATAQHLGSGQASVNLGHDAACALSTGGAVTCWGYNHNGQLGNNTDISSPIPVKVRGLSKRVKAQSQSTYTGCALLLNARVKCWGYVRSRPPTRSNP